MTDESRTRVAVACQGGGSHTAFTAGVLDRLLSETEPGYDIVGLTGTSGGAVCAFLTWYSLASAESEATGRERARTLLAQVWDDIAATAPPVALANTLGRWWLDAEHHGAPLPGVSPADTLVSTWTEQYLRRALERAVPPEELARVVAEQDGTGPTLHIGAVDVIRGSFRTFTEQDVSIDAVLASAAVPTLFTAQTVDAEGDHRAYWDGLFSQNPPIRDLLAGRSKERKPDEIWVVRINPRQRETVPTGLAEIADRRNELGGNLSLEQELAFVRRVNEWVAEGSLSDDYRQVAVRTISLDEDDADLPRPLSLASKIDCRPRFIDRLTAAGEAAADAFLTRERNRRLVRGSVDALWNTTNPAASVYLADDFELHAAGAADTTGPAVYESYVEQFRSAFADFQLDIDVDIADGDRVALVWEATGRHVGQLFGVAPTDQSRTVRGVQVARVEHRSEGPVIVEAWLVVDDSSLADSMDEDETVPEPRTPAAPVVTDLRSARDGRELGRVHAERLWVAARDHAERLARGVLGRDHVFRRHGADAVGRDAYVDVIQEYRRAFPDLRVSVRDVVAEGDRVVVRAAMTGSHRGRFEGVEPTGRRVEAHWAFVHEVTDGRITATGMVDNHGWLRTQLAARPVSTVHPARRDSDSTVTGEETADGSATDDESE